MAQPEVARDYFEKQEQPIRGVAEALADRIQEHGPHLTCKLAWGFPCWSGNERVFSVIAHTSHCNLQLWSGARLANPTKRIEGTGKALRHVKVRTKEDVDSEIDGIIKAALVLDATDPQKVR